MALLGCFVRGNDLDTVWPLVAVVILGGLIQGVAGFGFGLFSMGMLVLMMPVSDAVVIVSILSMASIGLNLWTVRGHIPWRDALPILLVSLPTTVLGVYSHTYLDPRWLRLAIAVMILAGCAVAVWSPKRVLIRAVYPWALIAGAIGGLFGGLVNMGGPPVVLYTLLKRWEKRMAKAAMSVYFLAAGTVRIAAQISSGLATPPLIRRGVLLLPVALAAAFAGTRIFARLSNERFRYVTTGLLVALAIKVVVS